MSISSWWGRVTRWAGMAAAPRSRPGARKAWPLTDPRRQAGGARRELAGALPPAGAGPGDGAVNRSRIEWTGVTWNPVTGCTKVSPGCDHCYAETLAERFRPPGRDAETAL